MAAPTPTSRSTPTGLPLVDGFSTMVTFANDADLSVWEKSTTPPGFDGGDSIDTTTFHNTALRTKRARQLYEMTECTFVCAYDPSMYTTLSGLLNQETTVTVTFADGSTVAFYAYLRVFNPSDHTDGAQPEATITIEPTSWDTANNVEAGPAVASVAGT